MKNFSGYIVILFLFGLMSCIKEIPPTISITNPADNDEYEQGELVTISINADDENGTVEEVRLFVDGFGIGSAGGFPYEFEWNTEDVPLGMHTIMAEARDDDGNSASDEISIRIIESSEIDTVLIAIINPTDNAEFELGDIVDIYVDVEDENRVVSEVRFYIDGVGVSISAGFPHTFGWNTEGFDIGMHTITAEARDEIGPVATDEINVTLIEPDSIAVNIVNPVNDEEIELGEIVSVYVDVEDANGIVREVRFYVDGIGVSSSAGFPHTYDWNTEDVDVGMHTITAEARDGSGPVASDEISVILFEPEPDTVSVTIVNPLDNEVIGQGETVNIYVNLEDEGERVTEVWFYIDGFGVGTAEGFPYTYNWNTTNSDLGIHTIKVEARDDNGPLDTDEINVQIN